jgi:hypothetical protein
MGAVIDLVAWKERDRPAAEPPAGDPALGRLDRMFARLDPLLDDVKRRGKREPQVETEILAITGALSLGLVEDAAARAERLAARLEARARRDAEGSPR